MKQYETKLGTFKPLRTDDLQEDVDQYIGMSCYWTARWIIESGPYEGQWAMTPKGVLAAFAWAPECDIEFE